MPWHLAGQTSRLPSSVVVLLLAAASAREATAATGPASKMTAAMKANDARVKAAVDRLSPAMIAARQRLHQNPELGNREVETARLVAEHLKGLGLEVKTGVAHTGSWPRSRVESRDRSWPCARTWTPCP